MRTAVEQPGSGVSTPALWAFFLIAVAWSWTCWLLAMGSPDRPATVLGVVGRFGPSAAALIVVVTVRGRSGLGRFLGRRIRRPIAGWDAVAALLGPPAVTVAALTIAAAFDERLGDFNELSTAYLVVPAFVAIMVLGGPLGEEIGWRGFALDPLQDRFGPIGASIVVGLAWGFWHLPLFFDSDQIQHDVSPLLFVGQTVSTAFVYTWLWNRSHSLLLVVVLHTSTNLSAGVFPLLVPDADTQLPFMIAVGLAAVVATGLVVGTGGCLGWDRQRLEPETAPDRTGPSRTDTAAQGGRST